MAFSKRVSSPLKPHTDRNSPTCVILCTSRAGFDGDTSCLYAANVDNYGSIGKGNPFRLSNREGRYIWKNKDVRMATLRVGDIVKYHVERSQYVYDEKTGTRMNIDQIHMQLNYGINTYRGIQEACPGTEIGQTKGCYLRNRPQEPKIFLVAIAGGVIQDERITFLTTQGETINLKFNCRDNLTLSLDPFFLQLKPFGGDEVNEVAVVKFGTSAFGQSGIYPAVCEGLILRYNPKVISVEEEPLKIKNAEGNFVDCPGVVTFDTGNSVATGISGELVKWLNLQGNIDSTQAVPFVGVGRDEDGNPITNFCSTVKISIEIREMVFTVNALYDIPVENTHLLIGMDIIDPLFAENFTLGK